MRWALACPTLLSAWPVVPPVCDMCYWATQHHPKPALTSCHPTDSQPRLGHVTACVCFANLPAVASYTQQANHTALACILELILSATTTECMPCSMFILLSRLDSPVPSCSDVTVLVSMGLALLVSSDRAAKAVQPELFWCG